MTDILSTSAPILLSSDLEKLALNRFTSVFDIPTERFKTVDDLVQHYGYRLGEKIAEGGFGHIYSAKHLKTGVQVACKQMDLSKRKRDKSLDYLDSKEAADAKNELYILKRMSCPYIVNMYAHFVANNHLYMFLKLANEGDFAKYVRDKGTLGERESALFFGQCLVAVDYMHGLGIVHRDIKLENVLLLKPPNGKMTLLVTDFGLSRVIGCQDGGGGSGNLPPSQAICGTPAYMSPELLAVTPFNAFLADIWALGVLLYAMLNGDVPFRQEESKLQLKAQMHREWAWSGKLHRPPSAELRSIMAAMLEPEPAKRIRMTALTDHPWIAHEFKTASAAFSKLKEAGAKKVSR